MNVTEKDRDKALAITGPCSCHEAYKSRGLTAPDCVFCDCAEGIADALAQARVDALEEAAKVAAGFAPPEGYDDFTIEGRAAMQAGDNIAAAIRALKEKP